MPPHWFAENFAGMGASLSALHTIDMSDNKLEGMDLPHFATLETLTVLDLSENSLRGDLSALALPPSLVVLNLDYNYFKGPVEASWFMNMSNVTTLRLSGNRLNCDVPRKCWYVCVGGSVVFFFYFCGCLLMRVYEVLAIVFPLVSCMILARFAFMLMHTFPEAQPPLFFFLFLNLHPCPPLLVVFSSSHSANYLLRHFMTSLQTLQMAKCGFTGPCPLSIADAKELQTVNFSDNPDLDGELPTSLSELYWLEVRSYH
jgi:hypothetical protein